MRDSSAGTADIICLSNWHGLGGAQLNAGLLTAEFERRGYEAKLGFLFERETDARHGTRSHFVISPRAPRSPADWRQFMTGCSQEIVSRRPRAIIGFQPAANIVGAMLARRIEGCRMVATQRNPSDKPSAAMARLDKLVGSTHLYDANVAVSQSVASSFDFLSRQL